jgi:erythromycin esterase-like protein
VLDYLDQVDPSAAARARARYACLDRFQEEPESYGYVTALGLASDCERQVLTQLADLQQQRAISLRRDGLAAEDEHFEAEQNARVVKDAEKYYRSMFGGRIASWSLRDTHMADTFDALLAHLGKRFDQPKLVVWAHNSHVGDARGTALGAHAELSLGQLVRERHPGQCCLIGFSTYGGTVTAAADWGGLAERKVVNAALPESYEDVFHRAGIASFLLDLRQLEQEELGQALTQRRLQRAIGVVYRPETERASHYFHAQLPRQFDAIIHIDQTRALEPLERASAGVADEVPETFPSGL